MYGSGNHRYTQKVERLWCATCGEILRYECFDQGGFLLSDRHVRFQVYTHPRLWPYRLGVRIPADDVRVVFKHRGWDYNASSSHVASRHDCQNVSATNCDVLVFGVSSSKLLGKEIRACDSATSSNGFCWNTGRSGRE